MPARKNLTWTASRKLVLWLSDNGISPHAFAERAKVASRTMADWATGTRKKGIPAWGLHKIALATGLPAAYWMNPDVGYPPPIEYGDLGERVYHALQARSLEELRAILPILEDAADLRQTLALRKAFREGTGQDAPRPPS